MNEHEWMAAQLLRNSLALIADAVHRGEMAPADAAERLLDVAVSVRAHLMIAAAEAAA